MSRRWVVAVLLVVSGCTASPSVAPAPERVSAQPLRPRAAHTASLLPDGRVLLAGGCSDDGCSTADRDQPSTEFYQPGRGFVPGPPMLHPRDGHSATTLNDGRILIVGGFAREGTAPITAAELFDPATATFRPAGTVNVGRGAHTATLLHDGRVLIAGGWIGPRTYTADVEIYDPATNTFAPAAPMPQPRIGAVAVARPDGDVLIIGGQDGPVHGLASTVIYNPAANAWRPGPAMRTPRFKHALATLDDGRVFVLGGTTNDRELLADSEILDPDGRRFTTGPVMTTSRYKVMATATANGRIVVVGGVGADVLASDRRSFTTIPAGGTAWRSFPTVTALPDGSVLVVGGYDKQINVHPDAFVIPAFA